MTPRQAFKVAFLMRCADEGLTSEQIHQRVKTALSTMEKKALLDNVPWGGAIGAWLGNKHVGGTAGTLGGAAVGDAVSKDPVGVARGAFLLPLGLAAGTGIIGGKLLAEAQKDPLTVDEAQTDEELAELERLTDRSRRMKQLQTQQSRM